MSIWLLVFDSSLSTCLLAIASFASATRLLNSLLGLLLPFGSIFPSLSAVRPESKLKPFELRSCSSTNALSRRRRSGSRPEARRKGPLASGGAFRRIQTQSRPAQVHQEAGGHRAAGGRVHRFFGRLRVPGDAVHRHHVLDEGRREPARGPQVQVHLGRQGPQDGGQRRAVVRHRRVHLRRQERRQRNHLHRKTDRRR